MSKCHYRDYATEAFRFYAAEGKPSCEYLKAKYMAEAMESYKRVGEKGSGISKPTEAALIYAEREITKREAELKDILAVEKVYKNVEHDVKKIIEIVYFQEPTKPLNKGDISDRVTKAINETLNSERSIYRILKAVRIKFAEERGLRMW